MCDMSSYFPNAGYNQVAPNEQYNGDGHHHHVMTQCHENGRGPPHHQYHQMQYGQQGPQPQPAYHR